jgi:cytochrome c553
MKVISLSMAVLAIVLPAATRAADIEGASYSKGGLEAKIGYCKSCHGSSGQGFHGYYTAPRLAGQTVEYIENQYQAIKAHTRDDPPAKMFMWPALGSVNPAMLRPLATHFSNLNSAPLGGAPRHLMAEGKKIYEEGLPDANVPACAACHGPDAKGADTTPRLAGQLYSYTIAQLKWWKKGFRSQDPTTAGTPNTMVQVASSLTDPQMAAVAAYLSYQK